MVAGMDTPTVSDLLRREAEVLAAAVAVET